MRDGTNFCENVSRLDPIRGERIDRALQPAGYNIGVNVGRDAGQTVMHVHVHIIPRYSGDVDDPTGGVRGVIPGNCAVSLKRRPASANLPSPADTGTRASVNRLPDRIAQSWI